MIRDRLKRGARRVKNGVKRRAKRLLGAEEPVASGATSAPVAPSPAPTVSEAAAPVEAPVVSPFAAAPELEREAPDSDLPSLTYDQVNELMEDMVRPALQSDGGDITLVKVEDNDVYVQLQGACTTCPSSTITMRQGIERLLVEEFPQFRDLIQVTAPLQHTA